MVEQPDFLLTYREITLVLITTIVIFFFVGGKLKKDLKRWFKVQISNFELLKSEVLVRISK